MEGEAGISACPLQLFVLECYPVLGMDNLGYCSGKGESPSLCIGCLNESIA